MIWHILPVPPETSKSKQQQAGIMVELELKVISVSTVNAAQCSSWHVTVAFVCVCARMPARARVLYDREKETRVDKMCPSSLCNYVPIFSPSVAFIIPLRSHLGVGDCHTLAPPSLNVCRMKCRSPPIDLCLPAPASLSPLFVSS